MLRKISPNIAIIAVLIYLTMFCINRVNSAMGFMTNDFTIITVLALCASSLINSCIIINDLRRRAKRRRARRRRAED